jgi:hypothetical protein
MPRDLALSADRFDPPEPMLPVLAPSTVWAKARREFAVSRIEQLPLRARMLDVLEHLDRGHMLALMGASIPSALLDGYPDIALLAGVLFTYGYVKIAGRHRDNPDIVYFTLSDDGRRKLAEGRAWWNRLSFRQRLQVRVFG